VVAAVVVCERFAPGGFDPGALEVATAAVSAIDALLIAAAGDQLERPEVAPVRAAPGPAQ
jgi:hypothetical protein